jgi:peptide/nickel transport system permease protein
VAWALIALLLLVAITGSFIKPHDISDLHANSLLSSTDANVKTKVSPPIPPGDTYLLGTDLRGFDLLSLILNGMKYTLGLGLLITVIRFVFALPLGFWSGATGKFRSAISMMQWITTSLPPLLFIYPLLLTFYKFLQMSSAPNVTSPNYIVFVVYFISMVSFIGIFPVCRQIGERARFYHDQMFVTASIVMGSTLRHRVFKHLLPNMRGELIFMFLTEFMQVLFLLGQLAVLGIFVSGAALAFSGETMFIATSSTGEWFGLIAYGAKTFRFEPWVIISVSCFFIAFVAIVQFFIAQMKKGPYRSSKSISF